MPPSILAFAAAQGTGSSFLVSIMPIVFIVVIFYFVLFRPMSQRQKALQKVIQELQKGEKVVTNGGLYGEVAGVESTTVLLKIADGVKVRVSKSAIAGKQGDESAGGAKP